MRLSRFIPKRPALAGAAVLSITLLLGPLVASTTHASISYCRTDPTVKLSNGAVISMYADTYDTLSNIKGVSYVLYGPVGTSVMSVTYDQYGYLEKFQYQAVNPPGLYQLGTTVAANPNAAVTSNAGVANLACNQPPKAKSGWATNYLAINFHCT